MLYYTNNIAKTLHINSSVFEGLHNMYWHCESCLAFGLTPVEKMYSEITINNSGLTYPIHFLTIVCICYFVKSMLILHLKTQAIYNHSITQWYLVSHPICTNLAWHLGFFRTITSRSIGVQYYFKDSYCLDTLTVQCLNRIQVRWGSMMKPDISCRTCQKSLL